MASYFLSELTVLSTAPY